VARDVRDETAPEGQARRHARAPHTGRQVLGFSLAFLIVVSPAGAGDTGLVRDARRLSRVTAHLVSARERVVSRCAADVLRCASAATSGCFEAVGRRCSRRLTSLAAVAARVARTGDVVAARLGSSLLDADEGLGYALLAPFCPGGAAPIQDASGALACQHLALACTVDRALALLAPQAAARLVDVGGAVPGCFRQSACGDGVVDDTEDCDDGAANSDVLPDHCRTSCRDADCGDGVVDEDEECDDGNTVDGDGCDADCAGEADTCGNGVVDDDEECDDGNAVGGDGCDSECTVDTSVCGDGIESDDEECDDGDANSDLLPDHCRATCRLPWCGDGVVDPDDGEECEPPDTLLCGATCEARIALPVARVRRAEAPFGRCARAILHRGLRSFAATRAAVGTCVQAAAACVLDDAGDDRCFTIAITRCNRAAVRRDRLRATTRSLTSRACVATTLPMLLAPDDGLGFRDVAARCPFEGSRQPAIGDLLDCLAERVGCLAERAIAEEVPRAYDFLSEVVDDPDTTFPCVVDPDELMPDPSSASGGFVNRTHR
jgi:cysteine-rich repeat protein